MFWIPLRFCWDHSFSVLFGNASHGFQCCRLCDSLFNPFDVFVPFSLFRLFTPPHCFVSDEHDYANHSNRFSYEMPSTPLTPPFPSPPSPLSFRTTLLPTNAPLPNASSPYRNAICLQNSIVTRLSSSRRRNETLYSKKSSRSKPLLVVRSNETPFGTDPPKTPSIPTCPSIVFRSCSSLCSSSKARRFLPLCLFVQIVLPNLNSISLKLI